MRGHLRLTALAVCATLWAGTAQADEFSGICNGFDAIGSDTHPCPARTDVRFRSAGPAIAYSVRILNPATACSDVRYVIRRSQTPFRHDADSGVTASYRLEPGQAQVLPIGGGFAGGPQKLALSAVLFKGRCSGRAALSWRAIVTVTRDIGS